MKAREMASLFSAMPGPGGASDGQASGEGGADSAPDPGDLVLGLEGAHVEVLVTGQLVEDVRCRGDRIGPVEEGET